MEYLESTGTQHIDTGIYPDATTVAEVECVQTRQNGDWDWVMGAGDRYNKSKQSMFGFARAYGDFYHEITGGNVRVGTFDANTYYDVSMSVSTITANDTSYATGASTLIAPNYSMWLFKFNNAGSQYDSSFIGKIYSCKISNDNTLVRDYIPVLDNDGVACMYDKVSGQLFYNQGTGDFIAGPVIPEPEPEPPISLDFQIGANSGEKNMLSVELGFSLGGFNADVTSRESAADTLDVVDALKKDLTKKRAEIGVYRNRIEGVLDSQSIKIENLSASHSTVVDTDFAKESAALVKSQILQQATSSLLKQANFRPNIALQLLS